MKFTKILLFTFMSILTFSCSNLKEECINCWITKNEAMEGFSLISPYHGVIRTGNTRQELLKNYEIVAYLQDTVEQKKLNLSLKPFLTLEEYKKINPYSLSQDYVQALKLQEHLLQVTYTEMCIPPVRSETKTDIERVFDQKDKTLIYRYIVTNKQIRYNVSSEVFYEIREYLDNAYQIDKTMCWMIPKL